MALRVSYQGNDVVVDEGSTLLIGAGDASQIRIARPGISRRHAVVAFDGVNWKVEDAGSRNGTYLNGERVHVTPLDGLTTLILGHPTEGEEVTFTPIVEASTPQEATLQAEIDAFVLPDSPPPAPASAAAAVAAPAAAAATQPRARRTASESEELTAAIRDQVQAVKGLTWSVWAMIAVTAALCVLTLFVGILGA